MKKIHLVFWLSLLTYSCGGENASSDASEHVESSELNEHEEDYEPVMDGVDDNWKETYSAELTFLANANINIPANSCECDQTLLGLLNKWEKNKINHFILKKAHEIFSKIRNFLPYIENCEFTKKLKEKRGSLSVIRGEASAE